MTGSQKQYEQHMIEAASKFLKDDRHFSWPYEKLKQSNMPFERQIDNRLKEALKRYWGYDAFRPKQEEIVRNILDGQDVCVVMPTGGGKSCVISCRRFCQPGKRDCGFAVIALMQDQVAQLTRWEFPRRC